ncbi:hypothetical protein J2T57_001309 [Natronocella acetinitrilica]|uniref:Uncharacterized protein n=1 Tax=Natronocella acetinitrilica TaxID=414046 RepID=A0AAE3G2H2_9GAMM|nr:hypothetical protein [Natronocella acetinitrilica]MCP1674207.1 hypothetical protein [Natronocella acetinitrilica]
MTMEREVGNVTTTTTGPAPRLALGLALALAATLAVGSAEARGNPFERPAPVVVEPKPIERDLEILDEPPAIDADDEEAFDEPRLPDALTAEQHARVLAAARFIGTTTINQELVDVFHFQPKACYLVEAAEQFVASRCLRLVRNWLRDPAE